MNDAPGLAQKVSMISVKQAETICAMGGTMTSRNASPEEIFSNIAHDIDGLASRHPMFIPRYRRMDYSVQEGFDA